ncbi:OLC1v1028043C1 [Oldenlandia corymbosa var. corymbosa]|uniref:OLC1v1028043C1 n=1 Tax=Oldenlandia corymbosa var. corymbosa TaxID=529605 RepID=A0AAV1CBE7_OLDCO|nr:OLC1v1028043C1 [Oldenlandia corymbosa var. corymbosa]
MAKGLIWATAEDLARNRGRAVSLYRQILRSLNSPALPLNLAKKAEVRVNVSCWVLKNDPSTTFNTFLMLLSIPYHVCEKVKFPSIPSSLLVLSKASYKQPSLSTSCPCHTQLTLSLI